MTQSVTVSYGSFSLTVDGYDDPFKVIREVTELYGKMSSVYPGFGAEPMQTKIENPETPTVPTPLEIEPEAELVDEPVEEIDLDEFRTEEPEHVPLQLEKPIPQYRRIDLSQIRAAAHPLSTSELRVVDANVKPFPANGEQ